LEAAYAPSAVRSICFRWWREHMLPAVEGAYASGGGGSIHLEEISTVQLFKL
jgi:hypothetical protein